MTTVTLPGTNGVEPDAITGVNAQIVHISSEQAADWLKRYEGPNRKISESDVLRYQSDMESGRWHFEGTPLQISKYGKLLNGQHRLTALANTVPGMTIPFLVVTGLEPDAQLYMDQHRVRTVGQQLTLKGVPNPTNQAAISKLYLDWTRNRLFKSTTRSCTSKPEVTEWALNHQDLLNRLNETPYRKIDAPASVVGAFALAILQISPARAVSFLEKLAAGTGLVEGDPILALDRRLRNIRRTGVRVNQREYLAYFIKTWNAWIMGDRMQKIQLNSLSEENFPELLRVADDTGAAPLGSPIG